MSQNAQDLQALALQYSDRCVMCGMCSQVCPTYGLAADENESPRGRIATMRARLQAQLPAGGRADEHLQHCLGCGRCESACPSGVPFLRLRQLYRECMPAPPPPAQRRLAWLLAHGGALRAGTRLLRILQGLRLAGPATRLVLGERARGYLPRLAKPLSRRRRYAARNAARGRVALFTGCLGDSLDPVTLRAAITLLRHGGWEVVLPKGQGCCGALPRQLGDAAQGHECRRRNLAAFAAAGVDTVLYAVSGCGTTLRDYAFWEAETRVKPPRFEEIGAFLARHLPEDLPLRPLPQRVFCHAPCSLAEPAASRRLLARIPALELCASPKPLPGCCGGGGATMLTEADIADSLGQQTLEAILAARPQLIASSNIGCALQLGAQLRRKGLDMEVIHPIVLLHRQLEC